MPYTTIIGLEVHVQLLTQSKLFCGCATEFTADPDRANTHTCPVCAGMPGALPVMNRKAFELALKTAVALNCRIPALTKWDRKNYFYPDLPKNYQISQYDLPLSRDGWLEIAGDDEPPHPNPLPPGGEGRVSGQPKRIGIIRAHLEEDTGKNLHDESRGRADSRIDLNRAGTPLLEIVTRPDLRSPAEARRFLDELKLLLTYLGVSDCNMQEGSLRVDANVNIHVLSTLNSQPSTPIPTPIVEIKNMNSFRAVERALAYEAQRQFEKFQRDGLRLGQAPKETRGWDDDRGVTLPQRAKEEVADYRYFPDPDLVPVEVSREWVEHLRRSIGELPAPRRARLTRDLGLSPYDADVIITQGQPVADYFEEVARRCDDAKQAANWVTQAVLRTLKERTIGIADLPVPPEALADLIRRVAAREINKNQGDAVFAEMAATGKSPAQVIDEKGFRNVADVAALEPLVDRVLAENPQAVADFKAGKQAALGRLIGMVKQHDHRADPRVVREMLANKLRAM